MRDPKPVEALLFDFNGTLSNDEGVDPDRLAEAPGTPDPDTVRRFVLVTKVAFRPKLTAVL